MGRARFRRSNDRVFNVQFIVHQLDSIPEIHRLLFVYWKCRRAVPSEGRTPAKAVEPGNVIRWNTEVNFILTIPAESTDATILQPSPITLQLRSERKARFIGATFQNEGMVQVDLADVAAVGSVAKNYLVHNSLLNTTLKLSIRVSHNSGDRIFRTRSLAANSVSSPHDTIDTGVDDDSAGTLPPLPSDLSQIPQLPADALDRNASAAHDRANITSGRPPIGPGRSTGSVFSSTAGLNTSKDTDATPEQMGFETQQSPGSVLLDSIPDPDVVQRHVYEKLFQERYRDSWPAHIVASRVDATTVVNEVYAAVCAADGIGVAGAVAGATSTDDSHETVEQLSQPDKTLSLEALIESRNGVPAKGRVVVQPRPSRKPSGKSPGLGVKSSSMGDLTKLEK